MVTDIAPWGFLSHASIREFVWGFRLLTNRICILLVLYCVQSFHAEYTKVSAQRSWSTIRIHRSGALTLVVDAESVFPCLLPDSVLSTQFMFSASINALWGVLSMSLSMSINSCITIASLLMVSCISFVSYQSWICRFSRLVNMQALVQRPLQKNLCFDIIINSFWHHDYYE